MKALEDLPLKAMSECPLERSLVQHYKSAPMISTHRYSGFKRIVNSQFRKIPYIQPLAQRKGVYQSTSFVLVAVEGFLLFRRCMWHRRDNSHLACISWQSLKAKAVVRCSVQLRSPSRHASCWSAKIGGSRCFRVLYIVIMCITDWRQQGLLIWTHSISALRLLDRTRQLRGYVTWREGDVVHCGQAAHGSPDD